MGLMAALGIIWMIYNLIEEALQPEIPASYWNNRTLINNDIMNPDLSADDFLNNLERGKYI